MLLRRTALEAVGGWHGDPGFMIDQATYCRVLLHGDLATARARWPPSGSARPSGASRWLASRRARPRRCTARSRELAPGLLSARDIRVGNATATLRAFQRRLVYLYLGRRMEPPEPPRTSRLRRGQQAELVVDERLPGPSREREAEPRVGLAGRPSRASSTRSSPVVDSARGSGRWRSRAPAGRSKNTFAARAARYGQVVRAVSARPRPRRPVCSITWRRAGCRRSSHGTPGRCCSHSSTVERDHATLTRRPGPPWRCGPTPDGPGARGLGRRIAADPPRAVLTSEECGRAAARPDAVPDW